VRILGSTVEEIAQKKAGIFKKDTPALVGPGCPVEVMRKVAIKNGNSEMFYTLNEAIVKYGVPKEMLMLKYSASDATAGKIKTETDATEVVVDDPDAINTDLCMTALHILKVHHKGKFCAPEVWTPSAFEGLRKRAPCRWEVHKWKNSVKGEIEVVLDVGHNPAAILSLMQKIQTQYLTPPSAINSSNSSSEKCKWKKRNVYVIQAMSRDKDVRKCMQNILTVIPGDRIHFTSSSNWRAMTREDLDKIYREETGSGMTQLAPAISADAGVGMNASETIKRVFELAAEATTEDTEGTRADTDTGIGEGEGGHCSVVVICGTG
jgi:folylpolyglutamate synthase/dihydropteroate synthase